ncbi:MAG TPA: gamma-glutamyltransferase [Thermoanaerobaculia bacterium]|nr:gamma-glutamyltransferase [Thermoanaerobaculia bacterium]
MSRLAVVATLAYVISGAGPGGWAAAAEDARPVVGRSVVATELGIVAASQPLAARAGVQILERGGNAVDAAIAANAAMGLMEPTGNGIGGDLFAIVHLAESDEILGLNASGWAPEALTVELLAGQGITEMPRSGIQAVTVPGVVAGWHALRERLGTLPFADLLAPAIHYAENGFPVSPVTAGGWARSERFLREDSNSAETFLPGGHAPRAGELFRNRGLAESLRRIAERGRDGYYRGETAAAIVAISQEMGGVMTAADLADFEPEWVTPISTTYRGWTVYEIGPNTQGIAALMMLDLMERFPIGEYGFHSTDALHVMIEAKKLAYADMLHYVGDPRFSRVPVPEMLDKEHAARRAQQIDLARASCSVTPSQFETVTAIESGDTIYLSVVDRHGNIVSLIQSNYSGFGSGVVPKGAGFMLHNRGALFTLEPDQPNTLQGRKRPLHTIIPAFMKKDDAAIGFGIMGGWNQAQAHAQFVSHVVDFGFDIQEALEAGRFTKGTFDGCDVLLEPLIPEEVRAQLAARGHEIEVAEPRSSRFGFGQAVQSNGAARGRAVHLGASEPRHDGAAIPEAPPVFEKGGS